MLLWGFTTDPRPVQEIIKSGATVWVKHSCCRKRQQQQRTPSATTNNNKTTKYFDADDDDSNEDMWVFSHDLPLPQLPTRILKDLDCTIEYTLRLYTYTAIYTAKCICTI